MARIRTVKPDFFTSEDVMALSPLARLLYIGTWLEADREGRLAWKPATLKVRYLPGDACDVNAVAGELVARGLVVLYGVGLAFIPRFKDHQFINGKEGPSKFEAPSDEFIHACRTRAGRVQDAPSFLPIPSIPNPSDPAAPRQPVQTRGASAPGSLPRDHMKHAVCGPSWRICLVHQWQLEELMTRYGGDQARPAVEQFMGYIEQLVGDGPVGDFKWLQEHFAAWMGQQGRIAAKAIKPADKPFSVLDAMEREKVRKAERIAKGATR